MSEMLDAMKEVRRLQRIIRDQSDVKDRHRAMREARAEGWTLDEIGWAMKTSRERVRQIVMRDTDA